VKGLDFEKLFDKLEKRTPIILGSQKYGKFSVLLPLVKKNNEYHILFEVRSHELRRQPGEICFPGGRIDESDIDEKHAAIRETTEELGIDAGNIKNVLPLDYMVTPFGSIIYPYVGVISTPEQIIPNPSEVAEIFTVPISYFQKEKPKIYEINYKFEPEKDFPFELIIGGEDYKWQVQKRAEHFYIYGDKVIWGMTARILSHFIEMINS
jgi:peroxisomal coenzyme A diphosphatase NUDT7